MSQTLFDMRKSRKTFPNTSERRQERWRSKFMGKRKSICVAGVVDARSEATRVPVELLTFSKAKKRCLNPDAIAETYFHLAHQDRSAWTMEFHDIAESPTEKRVTAAAVELSSKS